jgi:UDP-N-acetylglucosamine:LPS N-acetylglucosamine transferase
MRKSNSHSATIIFIAGEGGHIEQARRVLASFTAEVRSASHCVLITDTDSQHIDGFDECWSIKTCAPKHRSSNIMDLFTYAISSASCLWRMARFYNVRIAIVTGPGFALVPALGAKMLGADLLVFESWSRFESRSKCSKVLYRFSNRFFVQHKHLLDLYPKAIWVGLL